MPDTGAPWNIPYVDPTDLVRDYPQASEDLADAIADGLDAAGSAGIGSNVVSTILTAPFTTTSTSFTALTGLTAAITPSVDTAKVLVMVKIATNTRSDAGAGVRLMRDATPIAIGDADGARAQATSNMSIGANRNTDLAVTFLDSPGVDTAVTYSVEVFVSAGTLGINTSGSDGNNFNLARTVSTITAIEVAV